MITEAERNYIPKNWEQVENGDPRILFFRGLGSVELSRFCNTDSQRFLDLNNVGRGHEAVLLDYELIALGHEPICGSHIQVSAEGKLIFTVFTNDGPVTYLEV